MPSRYPDLTVRQPVPRTRRCGTQGVEGRIDELLRVHGLDGHVHALPGALSSGQLQAILMASALLRPPDLLVLDEPEQRLDPRARARLADLLRAEGEGGTVVLFATHQHELARVTDRVILLRDGAVVAVGGPDEVPAEAGA